MRMEGFTPTLRKRAQYLMANRPRKIKDSDISRDTGIPCAWLSSFSNNRVKSPNVDRIELLVAYLEMRKKEEEEQKETEK